VAADGPAPQSASGAGGKPRPLEPRARTRLEQVVFRNDLSPAEALDLVCTTEGEVDVVTEVTPADARRVSDSEHAKLVRVDAMRVLVGVINRDAEGAPLHDPRARRALNLAVDRDRLIQQAFAGCAYPLAGLTPHYAAGVPKGQQPYPHDADRARQLLAEARWRPALPRHASHARPYLTAIEASDGSRAVVADSLM